MRAVVAVSYGSCDGRSDQAANDCGLEAVCGYHVEDRRRRDDAKNRVRSKECVYKTELRWI